MLEKLVGKEDRLPQRPLPLREATSSGWLSSYRFFWSNCPWQPYLLPSNGGFSTARLDPRTRAQTKLLLDKPGVYELALMKGRDSPRYKVYVGQSGSIKRRFGQDYRSAQGSHLKAFFDEALKNGHKIYMRCHYTTTAEEAIKQEARLLKQYDYAWNTRQAGCRARHVNVVLPHACCFCSSRRLVCKPAKPEPIPEASSTQLHVEASCSSIKQGLPVASTSKA